MQKLLILIFLFCSHLLLSSSAFAQGFYDPLGDDDNCDDPLINCFLNGDYDGNEVNKELKNYHEGGRGMVIGCFISDYMFGECVCGNLCECVPETPETEPPGESPTDDEEPPGDSPTGDDDPPGETPDAYPPDEPPGESPTDDETGESEGMIAEYDQQSSRQILSELNQMTKEGLQLKTALSHSDISQIRRNIGQFKEGQKFGTGTLSNGFKIKAELIIKAEEDRLKKNEFLVVYYLTVKDNRGRIKNKVVVSSQAINGKLYTSVKKIK